MTDVAMTDIDIIDYMNKSLASYLNSPPANEFERGYLCALIVIIEEALKQTPPKVFYKMVEQEVIS